MENIVLTRRFSFFNLVFFILNIIHRPQLYVNGEFIGGCDIVSQMSESGELKEILADVVKVDAKE